MTAPPDPSAKSSAIASMSGYWNLIDAILAGREAMVNSGYLQRFPEESDARYTLRKQVSKMTNVFADVIWTLASKPFSVRVQLKEDTGREQDREFAEDVNGEGQSLTAFALETMYAGIAYAVDFVLVDHRQAPQGGDDRVLWVRYPAGSILALYTAIVDGKEEFIHVRFSETVIERDQFKETKIQQVRVLDREQLAGVDPQGMPTYGSATVAVWRKDEKGKWYEHEAAKEIGIERIPLVVFATGMRRSTRLNWQPPLESAADLQRTLLRQESGLEWTKEMTAFPVFTGNGVAPQLDEENQPVPLTISPNTVLYAPPGIDGSVPSWDVIEPSATSLTFLSADIEKTKGDIRELGRLPLMPGSAASMTVINSAVSADKTISAAQVWATSMEEALNRCFDFTRDWQGDLDDAPETMIDKTALKATGDGSDFGHVLALRKSREISRSAVINEAKRRNIMHDQYDEQADLNQIDRDLIDEDENEDEDQDEDQSEDAE